MLKHIQKQLPVADAGFMQTQLDLLINQLNTYNVSLNDDQRKGLRTMAEGREGFAKLVGDIALAHTESLPRNEDPKELQEALAYYSQLSKLRVQAAKLYEMLDDTQTATGMDVMAMVDRYSAYLQAARNANTALDGALNEVDKYNSRFGAVGEKTEKEPVATS